MMSWTEKDGRKQKETSTSLSTWSQKLSCSVRPNSILLMFLHPPLTVGTLGTEFWGVGIEIYPMKWDTR